MTSNPFFKNTCFHSKNSAKIVIFSHKNKYFSIKYYFFTFFAIVLYYCPIKFVKHNCTLSGIILYKFAVFIPYRVQRYYFFHGFTKVYIVHPIKIGAVLTSKYHLHFGEEESAYQGIFDARITFI